MKHFSHSLKSPFPKSSVKGGESGDTRGGPRTPVLWRVMILLLPYLHLHSSETQVKTQEDFGDKAPRDHRASSRGAAGKNLFGGGEGARGAKAKVTLWEDI